MKSIKIKGIVFRAGNSYGIRVRKALIDSQLLTEGEEVELELNLNDVFLKGKETATSQSKGCQLDPVYSPESLSEYLKSLGVSQWAFKQPLAQEPFH